MQKKNSHITIKKTKDIALSIQFSLDGFSFCVSDFLNKTDIYFKDYQFEETQNSPEDLLNRIKTVFKTNENLQLEYSNIEIIHQNNLSTLVPNVYFDENHLATYLDYNVKTLKDDFIAFDDISKIEAKNVYIPYVNINNYLFQNFGEFEYKHHNTVLLEKLFHEKYFDEKVMYVNVSKNSLDIIIIEGKRLILSNSFSYISKEDFIYYILFTAEQIKLNTADFKLFFMGEVNLESDIYKIAYKYVKNIFFLESKNPIFKDLDIANHSNYILLG